MGNSAGNNLASCPKLALSFESASLEGGSDLTVATNAIRAGDYVRAWTSARAKQEAPPWAPDSKADGESGLIHNPFRRVPVGKQLMDLGFVGDGQASVSLQTLWPASSASADVELRLPKILKRISGCKRND